MKNIGWILVASLCLSFGTQARAETQNFWVAVETKDKYERTALVNAGVSIETVVDDTSYAFVTDKDLEKIEKKGFKILKRLPADLFNSLDFPSADSAFHNYAELTTELRRLADANPGFVKMFSIGKSIEGRDIWAIRLNTDGIEEGDVSGKPGIVFMGGHHAREHVSIEMPFLLTKYLIENARTDSMITHLLESRDIFIIPMVNPDGAEYDISTGSYKMWRKNRRVNTGNRCMGVDLNRNYGHLWGTGGSSNDPCNDTHMGARPFSEPETQAIKQFVEARPNLKVLLSFHTFSELILYPWGAKYDPVPNQADAKTFETMAQTMARWNRYKPEQASDLYIASGDTTDWAYGTLGIFAFTFELSPSSMNGGGFYPGAAIIEPVFRANLRPALYLIDIADDPHRAVKAPETTLFYGRP